MAFPCARSQSFILERRPGVCDDTSRTCRRSSRSSRRCRCARNATIEPLQNFRLRVEQLVAELERLTANALRRHDYSAALRAIAGRLSCLKMIGELSGELRPGGLGEVYPRYSGAGKRHARCAAPEEDRDPERLVRRLCEVYNLPYPRGSKPTTVQ